MKRTVLRATAAPRAAFTMIELLIVIVVIAILVALLLPAVGGARYRARVAQVTSEIANLEKAIADFKLKYGINPPSRIVLCETASQWGDDWDSSPPVSGVDDADRRNSIAAIRQIWPQFGFGTGDMNGDGDSDDEFLLTGPECLLFFLGGSGILTDPGDSSDTPIANGFSANPGNPFASGGNRVGPFHEFDPARMVDLDSDGAWEYLDPLPNQTTPMMYISSDEGRGYDTDDLSLSGLPSPTLTDFYDLGSTSEPHKPNSYQIISPGIDTFFGDGGTWTTDSRLPVSRKEEWDNITNFSGGVLTQ
ncbi:hypothetical protein Mal4_57400 [Maioricimonas rarisocia]|uniref:Type II secretion system protein G n=1 Tax=Maioricimonas rarisocia TaxID=2528026 RepID=A0A517ZFV5_9PLAN|nr:prepilin-type N-terminal cleavage/methylation domain-containing protein [Maioricimonas rarisocia]QDU41373.1 hypothetical protein Mal4_57400 [Maioricimonas rarisocia]